MPEPTRVAGRNVDLSQRVQQTSAVVGSPALAAETIVAQIGPFPDMVLSAGVFLFGWAAFTIGGSGTAANLRLRQTNVAGAVVGTTGATTVVAGNLWETGVQGFDAAAVLPGQIYVCTLQITAGAAPSTVSAVQLFALVV